MDLRINQQYARIGLNIKESSINLSVSKPQVNMDITDPQLKIHSERPQIQIDQDACFADMNLRKPVEFTRYTSQMGKNKAMEAIGKISQEGDYLAGIEYGNSAASLARMNNYKTVEYNIGLVPEHKPTINFILSPVEIQLVRGNVNSQNRLGDVKLELDRGKVQVYMLQNPDIQITYVGQQMDRIA